MSFSGSVSDGSVVDDESLSTDKHRVQRETSKAKRGIIYLSTIPPYMNVTKVREIFGQFGELGRVYLQPPDIGREVGNKKRKPAKHFTEGWVEFKRKKVAKFVAQTLNNTQIGGRKKSKFYDHIWCIKYLPRFKWVHLSERLAYERAVRKQRLRAEISQAKREANYFSQNIDRSEKLRRHKGVTGLKVMNDTLGKQDIDYHQRKTDSEIQVNKCKTSSNDGIPGGKNNNNYVGDLQTRTDFLKNLFNSGS
ncbi:activator of basal transcription 1-like [Schistocerca americana]|uniref:activator of basal transcription 1-like n=1 Tax=Schistocerca americana TaxID=7009 RepID=UPI001F4FE38A|nr:activator of basal transcription 1-like [Schistocerca americana]